MLQRKKKKEGASRVVDHGTGCRRSKMELEKLSGVGEGRRNKIE